MTNFWVLEQAYTTVTGSHHCDQTSFYTAATGQVKDDDLSCGQVKDAHPSWGKLKDAKLFCGQNKDPDLTLAVVNYKID